MGKSRVELARSLGRLTDAQRLLERANFRDEANPEILDLIQELLESALQEISTARGTQDNTPPSTEGASENANEIGKLGT